MCLLAIVTLGYKCFHIPTNRTFVSRHVVFDEGTFPFQLESVACSDPSSTAPQVFPLASLFQQPTGSSQFTASASNSNGTHRCTAAPANLSSQAPDRDPSLLFNEHAAHTPVQGISPMVSSDRSSSSPESSLVPEPSASAPLSTAPTSIHPMITRNRDNTRKPRQFPDHVAYLSTGPDTEPLTFKQANSSPHWRQAMATELDALARNNTWTLVPPPSDHNIVGCKWVYKIKRNIDGSIARYKARLVAKGFTQEEGVDYFETFSPVVRPTTIRLVLSIAVQHGWTLRQLDVQNAFLHGDLHETVYMSQPPGFVDSTSPTHVCLLNKALYGLKQSPRAWFNTLSSALIAYGFKGSQYSPSLFVYSSHGKLVVILVYVDDLIITGNDASLISDIITSLQSKFATLRALAPYIIFSVLRFLLPLMALFLLKQNISWIF